MRQAIVIQNPKWELFTKASDAFKALTLKAGESAILVVRGRSKEKRIEKKTTIAKAAAIIAVMLFTFVASAQEDITAKFNMSATGQSNSVVLSGVPFGARPNEVLYFQGTHAGLIGATGTSNVVYSFDVKLSGSYWHTNAFTLSFPCVSSNNLSSIQRWTNTTGGLFIRVNNFTRGEANPFLMTEMLFNRQP
jgi:hypothetical protein